MPDQSSSDLTKTEFTTQVDEAFKNYASLSELSQSQLAKCWLAQLALASVPPVSADGGRAVRVLLRWSVERLAPALPIYPRPLDDPAWQDSTWRSYNILRHHYLDPLGGDYDFDEQGKNSRVIRLMALMGITSSSAFFDERKKAVGEAAWLIRDQLGQLNQYLKPHLLEQALHLTATRALQRLVNEASVYKTVQEIRRLAVDAMVTPLSETPRQILAISSLMRGAFKRTWLVETALEEGLGRRPEDLQRPIDELIAQRLLIDLGSAGAPAAMGIFEKPHGAQSSWLATPPVLQEALYQRQVEQARKALPQRHLRAANFCSTAGQSLELAWHLCESQQHERAVNVLLQVAAAANRPKASLLLALLEIYDQDFKSLEAKKLSLQQWCKTQVLLSDLFREQGQNERATAACERLLRPPSGTYDPGARFQGIGYHHKGKLLENSNPSHAAVQYAEALKRLPEGEPDWIHLQIDRGWLAIIQKRWGEASTNLQAASQALDRLESKAETPDIALLGLRANWLDAMSSMLREQQNLESALEHANRALILRQQIGNLARTGDSCNNIGNIYIQLEQYDEARHWYQEALHIHLGLDNQERIANEWLNIGTTLYYAGRYADAIENYRQSYDVYHCSGMPRGEAEANFNIAEAHVALKEWVEARRYWLIGYSQCKEHNLLDRLDWFETLRSQHSELAQQLAGSKTSPKPIRPLKPAEIKILEHVQIHGEVRQKDLSDSSIDIRDRIPPSTAKRALNSLVEANLLVKKGSVYYAAS